jgi:predicted RNase H-like HicB family nuclease
VEIDVASDGKTEDEALANLREALELYLEAPTTTLIPQTRHASEQGAHACPQFR